MRVVDRESHSAAYAKSWDAIEAYLAVAGATETVLALEERALVAGLRAEANRLANADHANLVRQSRSARAQLEAARLLLSEGLLEALAPTLRHVERARSAYEGLNAAALRLVEPGGVLATCSCSAALVAGPPTLQAAAELRLRYPSLSLRELAAKADPPLTKAAMAGRLARLVELAEEERAARTAPG